ncbi:glycosylhydrolase-like jelly roll fold domain-containing protein [Sphingobacterium sp. JB170]|uniref:glycosylhydrolase-like jelly roll fold domain-containing protein n=1 Tax=Sphingobacterium sp. JB170 TaxID=1434842 RepID=UPI00097F0732|nr:glycosylhydrolase-like jelly roll fold domain-containing protein [Sphingobacterium sp. JB170]SJN28344.1 predicted alpha-L-rhamnosidase [Sphingobacterium sp. JB170]
MPKQGSVFIIFRKNQKEKASPSARNYPKLIKSIPIDGPWNVTFVKPDSTSFTKVFDQLWDWSKHPDKDVNYFSGSATYEVELPNLETDDKKQRWVLSLGNAIAIASGSVNGSQVGSVWTDPYEIDITDFRNEQSNSIAIKVTNTWVNSLIGDQQLPENQRKRWTIVNPYKADSPLHSAGLLGPVSIKVYQDNQ